MTHTTLNRTEENPTNVTTAERKEKGTKERETIERETKRGVLWSAAANQKRVVNFFALLANKP